jgi:hypothetical protein
MYKLEGRQNKLAPAEVSVPQWITANECIREVLSLAFSPQESKDYTKYVKQIGDLLQIYGSDAVFTLDNVHRKEMAVSTDKRWFEIDPHMVNFYLVKVKGSGGVVDDATDKHSGTGSSQSPGASQSSGKIKKKKRLAHPCVRFNSKEGCKYSNNCTFPHICSEPGCMGSHPNFDHMRFRSEGSGKSSAT